VKQRRRRDLLVDGVLVVRGPQRAPQLGRVGVETQHTIRVLLEQAFEPAFQAPGLSPIAPMTNQLDTASQLTHRNRGKVERHAARGHLSEEAAHAGVRP
jgi:hypothetical protein